MIDTVQNARGKPLAAAYSVRPVASVAVSAPVSVKELDGKLRADSWTLETIGARVKRVGDLWGDFWKRRQTLERLLVGLSDGGVSGGQFLDNITR